MRTTVARIPGMSIICKPRVGASDGVEPPIHVAEAHELVGCSSLT